MSAIANGDPETYRVRYYDARSSKTGRGVRVRTFTDRTAAEAFARTNRLYARPCVVEVVR